MKSIYLFLVFFCISVLSINAQIDNVTSMFGGDNAFGKKLKNINIKDSTSRTKTIPKGLKTWTIDPLFGDRTMVEPDTMRHFFQNTIFTTGLRGEFNSLGNLGSPRQNRIFIERKVINSEFLFLDPYDFFIIQPNSFRFTSTLSPITNLTYNTAGNRQNGEDMFKALFAVNVGKRLGVGFKFNYLYGRGFYSNQSTSHLNYTFWSSYLGERYQAHLLASLNHQKIAENGGITNDAYITHPEIFTESYSIDEIPTILKKNWNRNDNQHLFFNHKYCVGFYRKVPMTKEEIAAKKFAIKAKQQKEQAEILEKARKKAEEDGEDFDEKEFLRQQSQIKARPTIGVNSKNSQPLDSAALWTKREYVPVTSFIHTMQLDNYRRIYQAYDTPNKFYAQNFYNIRSITNDTIYDKTKYSTLRNTFAIALLEGFNKWAKAGLKVFISHQLRTYKLPKIYYDKPQNSLPLFGGYDKYIYNDISLGGQIVKSLGKAVHYNASIESWILGNRFGQLNLDACTDFRFKLLGDTVQLRATAFLHSKNPTFYFQKYQSRHLWWNNNLNKQIHTRFMGELNLKKLGANVCVSYDLIKNYAYLTVQNKRQKNANDYFITDYKVRVKQSSKPISLITIQLKQNFKLGLLNWENKVTFQKSTNEEVLPVPLLNVFSNLFIDFKVAKSLKSEIGVEGYYFTSYAAPEYIPIMGSFGVQENLDSKTKVGNYPVLNVYANFQLQNTRFFIMYSHVNELQGVNSFLVPHYPINGRLLRFGISWNFFN